MRCAHSDSLLYVFCPVASGNNSGQYRSFHYSGHGGRVEDKIGDEDDVRREFCY